MSRRIRMAIAVVVALAAQLGCGTAEDRDPTVALTDGSDPTLATNAATGGDADVAPSLPPIPPIALPDISELTATGDVVADQLGDLISPISGVDLLTASCGNGGGDLTYQGSTGTDVFAIAQDGSGQYRDETDRGLVTLDVAADGSGEYYDDTGGGLVTITVAADGSGEYYREESQGKVTLDVTADGSGVYYDDREDAVLTVTLTGDGGGQLYHKTPEALLTVDTRADGSGTYYHKLTTGDLTTVEADGKGGWELTEVRTDGLVELAVAPDGSGRYRQTGDRDADFAFDPDGRGVDPNQASSIELPPAPAFAVAGRFPPLGKLGSLSPPCATVIRFEEQLLFDFNDDTVRPEAGQTLDQVVAALNQAGKPVEVNGHTDGKGSEDYNLELSQRRAAAVQATLAERGLTVQVTVNGYGESQPIAPNETETGEDDPAGRALNRRVEIVIRES